MNNLKPAGLQTAPDPVLKQGLYYPELPTLRLVHHEGTNLEPLPRRHQLPVLSERELEFLRLACTEYTYKEIARRMYLSPRTIDGYRDQLFEKLKVRTRVGLVIYAIRHGIFIV